MAQPPSLWQHETVPAADPGPASGFAQHEGVYESDDKLGNTWQHINRTSGGTKGFDLCDLLMQTRREETYAFPVPGVGVTVSTAQYNTLHSSWLTKGLQPHMPT
jgi:hypothetical protein